ncbi:Olfactory receptor 7C2 [Sciurus carolinensis]|uniref:Olfactory receptor 7C2 n=1 Tax=Sciurus carolinensis TaxID=30640 RepID=A0AA41MTC8_SCICA|nr:Olfactory receptor 7C2 [Sciurus carolinensis]
MERGNQTGAGNFILLEFSDDPDLQSLLFGLLLSMYLVTALGNLLIILGTISDSHLHRPMYFLLSTLSLADVGFTSSTIPKALRNIQTQSKVITFASCISQIYFFVVFGCQEMFSSILRISSAQGKYKAFSTCGSHLLEVSLFYGTGLGVYFSSAASTSPRMSPMASVMYTTVTPMLNPFIYSLRNRDIKVALGRVLSKVVPLSERSFA